MALSLLNAIYHLLIRNIIIMNKKITVKGRITSSLLADCYDNDPDKETLRILIECNADDPKSNIARSFGDIRLRIHKHEADKIIKNNQFAKDSFIKVENLVIKSCEPISTRTMGNISNTILISEEEGSGYNSITSIKPFILN